MKFIISSGDLLKGLDMVDGVVVSKPLIPILDNFLFEIKNKQLYITATDLETFMHTSVPIESDKECIIAVPSRMAVDTLKSLPVQPVTFSIDEKKNSIELNTGNGRYKLTGHDGKEFPKLPEEKTDSTITIPAIVLQRAIAKTVFATGTDELRLNLTGVYCEIFKDSINFVATDANRLVKYSHTGMNNDTETNFILPKKALTLLKNTLPTDDSPVSIEYNKSYAIFTSGTLKMICRLIDERYPDYNSVIPTENPNKLSINKSDFINALKRTAIYSNRSTNQVRLKVSGSEININAEDLDFTNEATERISCNFSGEDSELGFNARFLSEMVSAFDTDEIKMEFSVPSRASILLPAENEKDETLMMLIMPMRLNN